MILREWRAEIRRELRDEYVAYVTRTGLAGYRAQPGNLDAGIAVRDLDADRCEMVTFSVWRTLDDIRAFAGDEPDRAVHYPEDDRYLLTRPEPVAHYDLSGFARLRDPG